MLRMMEARANNAIERRLICCAAFIGIERPSSFLERSDCSALVIFRGPSMSRSIGETLAYDAPERPIRACRVVDAEFCDGPQRPRNRIGSA